MDPKQPRASSDLEDAIDALTRVFGREPDGLEPSCGQGSVNRTLRATIGTNCYAVRLNHARDRDAALAEYRREQSAMAVARTVGIRTANVVAIGHSDRRAWMIQEWVLGDPSPQTPDTYQQLGVLARHLAAAGTQHLGPLFVNESGGPHGQLSYNLAQLTDDDRLLALDAYAPEYRPTIVAAFQSLQTEALPAALHHGDLTPAHLLRTHNRETVLIDWGCAVCAVTPFEQINDLRREQFTSGTPQPDCLTAFLDGLGIAPSRHSTVLPVLNNWLLLRALDLVRWALDQCPSRVHETARAARRTVEAHALGALPLQLV